VTLDAPFDLGREAELDSSLDRNRLAELWNELLEGDGERLDADLEGCVPVPALVPGDPLPVVLGGELLLPVGSEEAFELAQPELFGVPEPVAVGSGSASRRRESQGTSPRSAAASRRAGTGAATRPGRRETGCTSCLTDAESPGRRGVI